MGSRRLLLFIDNPDGGLGAVAAHQSLWFGTRGWDVEIAGPRPGPDAQAAPSHRVETPQTARDVRGLVGAARQLRAAVDATNPTVVHCHGLRSLGVARLAGVRAPFVTIHGAGPVPSDPAGYEAVRRGALRLLPRTARAAFSAAPELPPPWRFLPHASPRLTTIDRRPFPADGPPTFLWLARLDEGRPASIFVDAVARLSRERQVRGVVAGGGPDSDGLQRRAAELGAPIEFVGHADPPPLLEACWALVLLSSHEAVNFAVQEAMWTGRPVVASQLPGIEWLAADTADYCTGVDDTTAALRRLSDRSVAMARGAVAGDRIREVLDPDAPWPVVEEAYLRHAPGLAR